MPIPQHDETEPDYELIAERRAEAAEDWATRDWNVWGGKA